MAEVERERYHELMDVIAWFFFDLLVLGYVEDPNSGLSFRIPGGLEWAVYIEVRTWREREGERGRGMEGERGEGGGGGGGRGRERGGEREGERGRGREGEIGRGMEGEREGHGERGESRGKDVERERYGSTQLVQKKWISV